MDLEQTQRLVEREEGLSLAHKFNCSFYETSAAHRCAYISLSILIRKKEIPPSPIPHWFFSGATWTMCSTPLSERLGSATRRENSKKTKRRVGKKFGTIFSKQSSGEGGRFKKILFCYFQDFHIYSDQSFVSFNSSDDSDFLPQSFTKPWWVYSEQVKDYIWNLYQNDETFWASKTRWRLSSSTSLSNVFLTYLHHILVSSKLLCGKPSLYMQCFIHVLISLLKVLQRQTFFYIY